jgi:anti-anti-sigma factor
MGEGMGKMNIIKTGKTLCLDGRLDTMTAPQLEPELLGLIAEQKNITLDFEKLVYVSSAGLRVLLAGEKLAKKEGGSMTLKNVSADIMEVFEMTGFVEILKFEE